MIAKSTRHGFHRVNLGCVFIYFFLTTSETSVTQNGQLNIILQLLLRGSAQRESRQREELLKSKKQKNEEQHLTLRQRRLLLLVNGYVI